MKQIDKEKFNKNNIHREFFDQKFAEERFWYEHKSLLGVILLDKSDNDWNFIALCEKNGIYRCFYVGTSFNSAEGAEGGLRVAFETDAPDPDEVGSRHGGVVSFLL